MKKITRFLCVVLCMAILASCFVGCAQTGNATGAYINMYLSSEVYNFDPAYAHLDSSAIKLLGLLYEGVMKLDDDGKVVKALCKDWKYTEDPGVDTAPEATADDKYTMEIELKVTAWSDGTALSADDFVYAWKRLLEPDFDGEGAELLYDIKGAIERKTLAESPDDIGLYADKQIITIEFAHPIDPEDFLRKLTSISLVPLRESTVSYYQDWSSASTTILTNGPFTIRTYDPGQQLILERNIYYMHDTSEDEDPIPDKTVKPFRIVVDYTLNNEQIMQKYEEGQLFFISELPASTEIRNQYKNKVDVSDAYSSHMYYFNTTKAPFDNAAVRKALSDVIDREAIANAVVFAKASTGMIPTAVTDVTKKDSFAANSAVKLSTTAADISAAKKAITDAGINPADYGTLKVLVRAECDSEPDTSGVRIKNNDKDIMSATIDVMVANMIVEQWNKLGFKFEVEMVNAVKYEETTSQLVQYSDAIVNSLYGANTETGKEPIVVAPRSFDVIALDYQMLDTTAFSALSVFSAKFSGCQLDFSAENLYETFGHITGYNSEEYNALIDAAFEAYKAGDKALLSQKLHEAEAKLLSDMPVIPIFEYQNVVLKSSKLSKIGYSAWGSMDFKSTKLKNWKDYVPEGEE
ncbi:MAG: hypothetical protein IJY04_01385 [Clostridia bacterium]|nr:hypothetical protein [Clostridia bacterium]